MSPVGFKVQLHSGLPDTASSAAHPVNRGYIGEYVYTFGPAAADHQLTEDRMYLTPLFFPEQRWIDRIGTYLQIVGNAGSVIRLGLYREERVWDELWPERLILDAGTVAVDAVAPGPKIIVLPKLAIGPGVTWLAAVAQACPVTAPTCTSIGGPSPFLTSIGVSPASSLGTGLKLDGVNGALPDFLASVFGLQNSGNDRPPHLFARLASSP